MRQFPNWGEATLAAGITSGATTFDVVSAATLRLFSGTRPWTGVIFNSTDYTEPGDDPDREIIECADVTGATLTVYRGRQRTTAVAHNTGGKTYRIRIIATEDDFESTLAARSVLLWGADRTGVANSLLAFQRCADDLLDAGLGSPWVPEGDYLIDGSIVHASASGLHWMGERGAILRQATAAAPIFDVDRCSDFSWTRLKMIGVGGDGVASTDDDCGIRVRSNAVTPTISDNQRIEVVRCDFEDFRFHGVKTEYATRVLYELLSVDGCRDGLSFNGVKTGTMDRCWIGPSMIAEAAAGLAATYGVYMDDADAINSEDIKLFGCRAQSRNNQQSFLFHSCLGGQVIGCSAIDAINGFDFFPAGSTTLAKIEDVVVSACVAQLAATGAPGSAPGNSGFTVGGNPSPGFATKRVTVQGCIVSGGAKATGDNGMAAYRFTGDTEGCKYLGCEAFDSKGQAFSIRGNNNKKFYIGQGTRIDGVVAGDVDPGTAIEMKTGIAAGAGIMTGTICDVDVDNAVEGYRVHADDGDIETVKMYHMNWGAGVTTRVATGTVDETPPTDYSSAAAVEYTIATDEITIPTWLGMRSIIVDTEADAASDVLDTITGGVEGQIVCLASADDARDITVQEGGNLALDSNTAHALNNTLDSIVLRKRGSLWAELSRVSAGA